MQLTGLLDESIVMIDKLMYLVYEIMTLDAPILDTLTYLYITRNNALSHIKVLWKIDTNSPRVETWYCG